MAGLITAAELRAQLAAAHAPKSRKKRPGQLLPPRRAGRQRVHGDHGANPATSDDGWNQQGGQQFDEDASSGPSEWAQRKQREHAAWKEARHSNLQHAQQYAAFRSNQHAAEQQQAQLQLAAAAVAAAGAQHPCCLASIQASDAERQQQQQVLGAQLLAAMGLPAPAPAPAPPHEPSAASQQQQQQAPVPQGQRVTLLCVRPVACHTAAASGWLAVPTCRCQHCGAQWEVAPAAAGFFGSSPWQPNVWFHVQLLEQYARFSRGGLSGMQYAAALSATTAAPADADAGWPQPAPFNLLPIDDR